MNYTVEINRMKLYARHGVMAQERHNGNLFEVSVRLDIEYHTALEAFENDRLVGAANYAEIADVIKRVMSVPSSLLENVAYRLHAELRDRFANIVGGSVTIAKLTPPIRANMESASVTLSW